ncbi:HU family DNA-binding protein, partial [Neobacillus cucumis]|uniref:HU family DNA-binding protein n=1 Tax=Neobacillus cucumis TaxID=1740721 RepID=UPI003609E136
DSGLGCLLLLQRLLHRLQRTDCLVRFGLHHGCLGAMKTAKAMTKGAIAEALATEFEMKKTACSKLIDSLAVIATKEVKSAGKFVIPGVCMIKTRVKPARKAGKRMAFGKEVMVKAQPAKTVVKAFPVSALKKSI